MSATTEPLEEQIEIGAAPSVVWPVVSDLKRMGEWSAQCRRVWVLGGVIRDGALMVNLNRAGVLFWPTTARVVRHQPDQAIAFRIIENRAIWSFELQPLDDAARTRVVERRLTPDGTSAISRFVVRRMLGGHEQFEASLRAGMRQTLERIRREIEG